MLLVSLSISSLGGREKRSGQAGLLVPKAATTARESLKHPPFATFSPPVKRENVFRLERSFYSPRARSMNSPGSTYLQGS